MCQNVFFSSLSKDSNSFKTFSSLFKILLNKIFWIDNNLLSSFCSLNLWYSCIKIEAGRSENQSSFSLDWFSH